LNSLLPADPGLEPGFFSDFIKTIPLIYMRTESRQMPDYVHYVISGTDNAFEQTIHCYSITAKKCFAQQNAASHLVVNSSWSMGYGRLCLIHSVFSGRCLTRDHLLSAQPKRRQTHLETFVT
ncbi:hypothetical protein ACUOFC_35385, partial [Escherichia sp. TWPC-MK]